MNHYDLFTSHQYLNLETFRRNSLGVQTPVWFVQDGNSIFVRTLANSGKVKRIRNNKQVNIAPCKVDGKLLGAWYPCHAQEIPDPDTDKKVDHLLYRKYGVIKKLFALSARLQDRQYTVLKLDLLEQT